MTIMITNLPIPHDELKAFIEKHGFEVEKIKPMSERHDKSKTTEYVRLVGGETAESQAIEVLNGCTLKGNELSVSPDTTYHPDQPPK